MISSPVVVKIRNFTRKLGLNKVIAGFLASAEYEDKFGNAITTEIKVGDTVWDIGANLGIYTEIFSQKATSNGRIVAFEPVPPCFSELQRKFNLNEHIILKNMAIGSEDGILSMNVEENPLAATHKVVDSENTNDSANIVKVKVCSADSIIQLEPELVPNIIKIDVEGFEGQVIDGMQNLLKKEKLRCIGIEIHFGLLNERGETNRPQEIEKILKINGFKVSWTDSSHILATR